MRNIQLEVLNDNKETIRTYHLKFNEDGGHRMRITIGDNVYVTDCEGKLVILTQDEIDAEIINKTINKAT